MIQLLKKFLSFFILAFCLQTIVFAQTNYERAYLWDQEIAAYKEADARQFPEKSGVVFVGSSSIRMWTTLQKDFPEFYTINRGFGGSRIEDVNYYAPQIVFPYKPRVIVLYAGENDITDGKSVQSVLADFKKFVSLVKSNLPGTRVIYVSVKPSPARAAFASIFKQLNELIKNETKRDRYLSFVDVWTPMLDANGEPRADIFHSDRVHLNDEGYKIWRKMLFLKIKMKLKGAFY